MFNLFYQYKKYNETTKLLLLLIYVNIKYVSLYFIFKKNIQHT